MSHDQAVRDRAAEFMGAVQSATEAGYVVSYRFDSGRLAEVLISEGARAQGGAPAPLRDLPQPELQAAPETAAVAGAPVAVPATADFAVHSEDHS